MTNNPIPLIDLKAQYRSIEDELLATVKEVLASGSYILGPYVEKFEKEFTDSHNANMGLSCSNGTSALVLALEALGIGPGDEVITSTYTFIATVESILHVGATPVLIDIDPGTYNFDLDQLASAVTANTKAVIAVHLYGNPCMMDEVQSICNKSDIAVIEDTAQAHFAKYNGQYVGTFGAFGTFSFYPAKNLGAYGDAGFVFIEKQEHYDLVKKLRDHGRSGKYLHDIVGHNFRMDSLQAALLSVKLKRMLEWTAQRRACANHYREFIDPEKVEFMKETPNGEASYHLFVISCENRDEVQKALSEQNVATGVHYQIPVHLQPAMKSLGYQEGRFPVSEAKSKRIISLPLYPELEPSQIEFISNIVNEHAKAA